MKRANIAYAALVSAFFPLSALAQQATTATNTTIYGLIDAAYVHQSNANANGQSVSQINQGGEGFMSGSRIGFKGERSLPNGFKGGFLLEAGFLIGSGKSDQQQQLFGRQAYVSLGNDLAGTLSFGRQYTTANTMGYYVEPLGIGAAPSNSWLVYLTGQRYDNSLVYTKNFGPVQVIAQHAFGGIAGDSGQRSSNSLGVKYQHPSFLVIGDAQETEDINGQKARIAMFGARAPIGNATLYANYIDSKRDENFDSSNGNKDTATITSMTSAPTAATNVAAAINSKFAVERKDKFYEIGIKYDLTSNLKLFGAYMANQTKAAAFSGTRKSMYGVVDYFFDKDTDAYFAIVNDRVTKDWKGLFANSSFTFNGDTNKLLNGKDNQLSLFFGARYKFQ